MKKIIINTQKKLDALKKVGVDERVTIEGELVLGATISVLGALRIGGGLKFNFGCWVEARENSSVEAWGNSSVEARGNSSVEAWENSSVVARGNSSVVARGNSVVRITLAIKKIILYGFSICFKPFDLKFKIERKSKTTIIQNIKPLDYFERNGIKKTKKVILYKRVSHDYKTQEGKQNETLWLPGTTVEHPRWNPKENECGEGKFHAVSRPYFADEFRNKKGDRYVAIEIESTDLREWKNNPQYPHKIGFRRGRVLRDVDKFGKPIVK